jgi:hypothetical protein
MPLQTYEAGLGKRTRSGKDYDSDETQASGKEGKKEQGSVMDVDEEIARITQMHSQPTPTEPVPSKVRFQETPSQPKVSAPVQPKSPAPKEKSLRKTYLEKPLAKAYPGIEEEVARRIIEEGNLTNITVGELMTISDGVAEHLKDKVSNRRIPIKEKLAQAAELEGEEEEEDPPIHYSFPFGYVKVSINGQTHQALLDTGSMVNIIPSGLAHQLGLVVTEKPMNLKGMGGHDNKIPGAAERVESNIGSIKRLVHFCVADGSVQFVLGKPFLMDVSASINYNSTKGESLNIKDSLGQNYLVPIAHPKHQKWETSLSATIENKVFLDQSQEFQFSP